MIRDENQTIKLQAKQILKSIKININMINKLDKYNFFSFLNKRFLIDAIAYENYQLVLIGIENLRKNLKVFIDLLTEENIDKNLLKQSQELVKMALKVEKADPITIKTKIKALSKNLKAYETIILNFLKNY